MGKPNSLSSAQELEDPHPPRNLRELFLGFLAIGGRSFGPVLPWAYRTLVEERRWITAQDFNETIGLCQLIPGPHIINASIMLGKRWFGVRGAVLAFVGFVAVPFVWVMALGVLYLDVGSHPTIRAVITGVAAAGAGLLMATAIKLGKTLKDRPGAVALTAACFLAVGVGRYSMFIVVPIILAVGVLASRRGWL